MNMIAATTSKMIAAIIMSVERNVTSSSFSVCTPVSRTLNVRVAVAPVCVELPAKETVIVQTPVIFWLEEVL